MTSPPMRGRRLAAALLTATVAVAGCGGDDERVEAGKTSQVTAADYVADNAKEGRTEVRVQLRRGRCLVVIPIGGRRVAVFVRVPDRDLYTVPERQTLPQGARVAYNARGRRDGSIALR